MIIARRFVLGGLLAAPMIVRTVGLLMPVRPLVERPVLSTSAMFIEIITADAVGGKWFERQPVSLAAPTVDDLGRVSMRTVVPLMWTTGGPAFITGWSLVDAAGREYASSNEVPIVVRAGDEFTTVHEFCLDVAT